MKKFIAIISIVAVVLTFASCKPKNKTEGTPTPTQQTESGVSGENNSGDPQNTSDPQNGGSQNGDSQVTAGQDNSAPAVTPDLGDGGFDLEEDILTGSEATANSGAQNPTVTPNAQTQAPVKTEAPGKTQAPSDPTKAPATATSSIVQNPDGTITLPFDRF